MNAIVRAGHTPFALSTRNTGPSLVHLLSATGTAFVYTSSDPSSQKIFTHAMEILGEEENQFPMPNFEDFQANLDAASLLPPLVPPSMSSVAIILHSSGKRPLSFSRRSS